MENQRMAYLQLAGAMALAGTTVVTGKIVIGEMPIFLGSALRYGVAAAVLLPVAVRLEGSNRQRQLRSFLSLQTLGLLFAQSLFGNVLFSVCLLYGLRYGSAASAGLMTSVTPAFITLGGALLLRERPTQRLLAGVALAAAGVAVTHWASAGSNQARFSAISTLLFLGAVGSEALFTLVGKAVSRRIPPVTVAALTLALGFLSFLPLGTREAAHFDWLKVTTAGWGALLFYGVAGTAGSYALWFTGLSKVDTGVAGVFVGVMPVTALALSATWLREPLHPGHGAGVLLVVVSLLLVTSSGRKLPLTPSRFLALLPSRRQSPEWRPPTATPTTVHQSTAMPPEPQSPA